MSIFIKAGFWENLCKSCKGYKGWLNLEELITNIVNSLIHPPTYKVYTALLTGGNSEVSITGQPLIIGHRYQMNSEGIYQGEPDNDPPIPPDDFSNFSSVPGPNTIFVATQQPTRNFHTQLYDMTAGAPVINVLENTLGDVKINWIGDPSENIMLGDFSILSNGLFTNGKTFITGASSNMNELYYQLSIARNDSNRLDMVTTVNGGNTYYIPESTPIEIRVYN